MARNADGSREWLQAKAEVAHDESPDESTQSEWPTVCHCSLHHGRLFGTLPKDTLESLEHVECDGNPSGRVDERPLGTGPGSGPLIS